MNLSYNCNRASYISVRNYTQEPFRVTGAGREITYIIHGSPVALKGVYAHKCSLKK